ncbi:MAG: hypothetical protein ACR2NH_09945 [Solirubrobacteraceae bacterium]
MTDADHPAIRIDPPGCGDAGGTPRDPDCLGAWTRAAAGAARWLRSESGCLRVAAIGLGVGGLVAYRAAALEAGIDDLVLWGVPRRGRALVREMTAFARLNADESSALAAEAGPDDGSLEVGGFLLSADTLAALGKVDLTDLALSRAGTGWALLLARDGTPPDSALAEHLEGMGVAVGLAPGEGFATLTSTPQLTRTPTDAIDATVGWLAGAPAQEASPAAEPPLAPASIELEVEGSRVRERPVVVEHSAGLLHGVLSEPAEGPTGSLRGLLLNAGAVRRTGPGRLWVELARSWAAHGVITLRIDSESIGDADGARDYTDDGALYVPELVDDAIVAMDAMDAEHGVQERPRYLLGGLCSGAFWSFHAALRDARVRSVLMLNPRALHWHEKLAVARDARKMTRIGRGLYWRRLLTGQVSAERLRSAALWAMRAPVEIPRTARRRRLERREVEAAFDQLRDEHKRVTLVFGEDEPLDEELQAEGLLDQRDRWPNVELQRLPGRDHTLRPMVTQQRLHALVARLLERELEGADQPEPVAGGVRAT